MIDLVRIDRLHDDMFQYAGTEFVTQVRENEKTVRDVLRVTHQLWLMKSKNEPLGVVGVVNHCLLTQSAYLWFVPFMAFRAKHARAVRPLFTLWAHNYNYLLAQCFDDRAVRFAEFFGFEHKNGSIYERIT